MHGSLSLISGDMFHGIQWPPGAVGSVGPYKDCVFPCSGRPVIKSTLSVRHSERLAPIPGNKIEQS